ncbi:MAG: hypothetical protein JO302_01495 [Candidatus Eremiobacteraeota bacterium]|nr:hypothetical protein [Candidatus Eremiobacteraeota bacterium]
MTAERLHDLRYFTAFVLAAMGAFQIFWPDRFHCMNVYFKGTRRGLSQEDSRRLGRVLEAREAIEDPTNSYARWSGVFTIVMGGVELIAWVPFAVPYALSCLAIALSLLLSYFRIRRASERRVAPLTPRSSLSTLPPFLLGCATVCVLGAAAYAVIPGLRTGALLVALSVAFLVLIAWQVAGAPALLFGQDPQLEYKVDEHLRVSRSGNILALACAPAMFFVCIADVWAPELMPIKLAVIAAFILAMIVYLSFTRKRIQVV